MTFHEKEVKRLVAYLKTRKVIIEPATLRVCVNYKYEDSSGFSVRGPHFGSSCRTINGAIDIGVGMLIGKL